jgi:hypothetical protein
LEDLGIDDSILKWVLRKQCGILWTDRSDLGSGCCERCNERLGSVKKAKIDTDG